MATNSTREWDRCLQRFHVAHMEVERLLVSAGYAADIVYISTGPIVAERGDEKWLLQVLIADVSPDNEISDPEWIRTVDELQFLYEDHVLCHAVVVMHADERIVRVEWPDGRLV